MLIFGKLMRFGKEIINCRNKVARSFPLVRAKETVSLAIINTQATMTEQENAFSVGRTVNMQLACKCDVIAGICFTVPL